jgi:methionyl-tRNA formyltransferase
MNVLFTGSAGPLSVLPLRALCDAGHRPCAVAVDAGDNRLSQRRDIPLVSENQDSLESFALLHDLPLIRLSRDAGDAAQQIRAYSPNIVFVSCFARKIPHEVLSVPAIGCFNLHPSALPAYRGPDPVFWQFREGVNPMGVTLHQMSAQLDAGDIVDQTLVAMPDGITLRQASRLLAEAGGRLLVDALLRRGRSGWSGRAQQEEGASYRGFPAHSDYAVSTRWPAQRLFNFMRATRGEGIVYPCKVDTQTFSLVEAISFQKTGAARLHVQGDEVILPCRSGFIRARFIQ